MERAESYDPLGGGGLFLALPLTCYVTLGKSLPVWCPIHPIYLDQKLFWAGGISHRMSVQHPTQWSPDLGGDLSALQE